MAELLKLPRSQCSILPLVLKGKWFDMIERGEKREEYRLATEYWQLRFFNWNTKVSSENPPIVEFRRGYTKNSPRMAFWCYGLNTPGGLSPYAFVSWDDKCKIRHPEWGEPENAHFVIQLGGRVELTDSESTEVPSK